MAAKLAAEQLPNTQVNRAQSLDSYKKITEEHEARLREHELVEEPPPIPGIYELLSDIDISGSMGDLSAGQHAVVNQLDHSVGHLNGQANGGMGEWPLNIFDIGRSA